MDIRQQFDCFTLSISTTSYSHLRSFFSFCYFWLCFGPTIKSFILNFWFVITGHNKTRARKTKTNKKYMMRRYVLDFLEMRKYILNFLEIFSKDLRFSENFVIKFLVFGYFSKTLLKVF